MATEGMSFTMDKQNEPAAPVPAAITWPAAFLSAVRVVSVCASAVAVIWLVLR